MGKTYLVFCCNPKYRDYEMRDFVEGLKNWERKFLNQIHINGNRYIFLAGVDGVFSDTRKLHGLRIDSYTTCDGVVLSDEVICYLKTNMG